MRNRRGVLRTDVGAGRCEWFRGRACVVTKVGVLDPDIFRFTVGNRVGMNSRESPLYGNVQDECVMTAVCVHYATGLLVLA